MSYQEKIYATLEFAKVQAQVANYIQTDIGKEKIQAMTLSFDRDTLIQWQSETEQALGILNQNKRIPIPRLVSLRAALQRLKLQASLNGIEIANVGRLLSTIQQIVSFFDQLAKEEKVYPALSSWVNQMVHLPAVQKMIEQAIDQDGSVLSSASAQLASIRRQQAQTDDQIRNQLGALVKSKANQLSDTLVTMRNDVYVLPVKAEYRNQFGGRVHDQSSTGQTLYIEPQAVLALNQKRAELIVAEAKEIQRILDQISADLMPHYHTLKHNQEMVGSLDFIQARAEHAKAFDAVRPSFSDDQSVTLWQARHPLIDPQKIVPNDLIIGGEYKSLIITGPNTGGKTILLKTLGLLQLMAQTGLHIPADKGSIVGIFDHIYADIGDEQSIEQSLSTFSSHMTNIVKILDQATYESLLLFDELGSGTDPQEGAALAMAILNYLRKIDATVMATTHYPELKVYAHETESTINASMEFDVKTLSPTYRLLIGVPGRSNAFDISQRLGLRLDILEEARAGIDQETQSVNEMVAKLERQRREAELAHSQAIEQLEAAEQLHRDLRTEYNRWLDQKNQLVENAKRQANEQVQEAKDQAEKILQEIRDLQLEQGSRSNIKEHVLIDKRKAFDDLKQPENLKKNKVLRRAKKQRQYQVGDDVQVLSYGQRGTIIEQTAHDTYVVQMGILKIKLKAEELEPLEKVENKVKVNVQRQAGSKVQTSLDLRGERYENAIFRLRQYLDAALLSNHPMVTIIHGKGTGALRQGVKETLSRHPQVDRFEYSPPNAGGDGSTIVYFK